MPSSLPETDTDDAGVDLREVARAFALLWSYQPRAAVFNLLRRRGVRAHGGRACTQDQVQLAVRTLLQRGDLVEMPHRQGYYRLRDDLRVALYRELLENERGEALREAVYATASFRPGSDFGWSLDDQSSAAVLRVALFTGAPEQELTRIAAQLRRDFSGAQIFQQAVLIPFDGAAFARAPRGWQHELAFQAVTAMCWEWAARLRPVCDWAIAQLDAEPGGWPEHLRLAVAELLLHRGEADRAQRVLDGMRGGAADAVRAGLLVQAGRWQEAQAVFESALKRRGEEVGARKRVLPVSLTWLYPLSLLAQQSPGCLAAARKFCLSESGRRNPEPDYGWGLWVHAIAARLGDTRLRTELFDPGYVSGPPSLGALWRLMLAAWLGPEAVAPAARRGGFEAAVAVRLAELRRALDACGLAWLAAQAEAATAVLRGRDAPPQFFACGRGERWRELLAALQALGAPSAAESKAAEVTRILWLLRLDGDGAVEAVQPMEQKRGVRGWSRPKPLPLAKLGAAERLAPLDARVARAVRQRQDRSRRYEIDRAAAVAALVGHPVLALEEAPEQLVELVEGTPELEVVREGERFLLRVTPELRVEGGTDGDDDWHWDGLPRDVEALRSITVVRDSPQRLRLIRFTPAQRRAAQLLAQRVAVPEAAQAELQQALQALSGHFQVHADTAQAARELPTDSRLRAELAPAGESLTLRLVVAPLGSDGPRLAPGAGRLRLMAAVKGESLSTQRDLAAERAHVDAVLDALPFLDEPGEGAPEWVIDDPEQALAMVEVLPGLPGVAAVDWPKGRKVQVLTVDAPQLALRVHGQRDWFALSGRAQVDEERVLELEALLAAAQGRSRFIPMGEGVYAALTQSLRARLAELAALAETDRHGSRVPQAAAAWLREVLDGVPVEADAGFRRAIERLRAAQEETPRLPGALQAQLRPYQEDGYAWAMRLAAAGLGGCLADDMGLGKTLQALALLLARAAGGPALVVAPTSVCGNWIAEAGRFAPTLDVALYGEGEREALLANAGPGDVLVVSYTLLQQAQANFASRRWHTLVADEAQAIKNATAKRSLALFELEADFRLALSGTPVENRLAELWSIMRFANPGLLGAATRFNTRFAAPIERNRDRHVQQVLRRLIAPFVLRRTKAQVLPELPPRTELVLAVAPEAEEAAHYEALRRQAVAQATQAMGATNPGEARMNILAQITRLRRAACDPRLANPDFAGVGAKQQAFAELAAELAANGHKALVFSQFVDFLSLLRKPLDAAGIAYQYLDGATPAAERTRRVAAFQAGEGDLFLISLKAGGFGLNLTAADYVVIADPWWNPAAEDQAMGRAHRIGQQRPVTVYRLVTRGTIEERIVELHHDKRALADSILAEGEAAALPSTEELIALMHG
jgi:superfamily II DNA or RNA helicase